MRKFLTAIVLGAFIALSLGVRVSSAGEIDLLLQKLVEKGVLTPGEAQQIGTETKEQVKKEIAAGTYSSLPAWVQNTKLKGDFRLRYQYNHVKQTANNVNDRHRGRMRLRVGLESKVNEKVLVGFGLATGLGTVESTGELNKDYARSTNQTFSDAFSKKPVTIDYAFMKYSPKSWAAITAGKFKNPLWEPGDMLWDTDINPEGATVQLNKKLDSKTEVFLNNGVLIIDERSGTTFDDDPVMFVVQPGVSYQLTDTIAAKAAFSYYNFIDIKGRYIEGGSFDTTNGRYGNSRLSNAGTAGLRYNFATLTPALEISVREPLKALNIPLINFPYFSIFGEFVNNPQVSDNANGHMIGFRLGAEKIANWGEWQLQYSYTRLERDAIPDFLPDSDRFEGSTGFRGHEAILQYGLGKNVIFSFDYYNNQRLIRTAGAVPEHVFQTDLNFKF